jgi:hypothetical protein
VKHDHASEWPVNQSFPNGLSCGFLRPGAAA